ncbi:unnamed protein product [Orchesella dallaii]|uniref:Uncharacterized protein n=1 Tax=Orchesella dallaii TaxID=48710 RepID=A0ABP1PSK6_9HEXA
MGSQKFALIAAIFMSLPVGIIPFLFQLDNDCFINFVGTGINTEFLAPFMNGFSAESAYTFSIRSLYSNLSSEEELYESVENITLQDSYFRYNVNLRGSCLVFMLYTSTFNETVTAIHDSGFGTSDEVLFFIQVETMAEWEDHVEKFSALHQHSSHIFHANVVFMGLNSSYVGVHCYFCPPNPNRLHLIQLNSFPSYFLLKRFAQHLNSHGHGRHAVIKSTFGDLDITECFNFEPDTIFKNRETFFTHIRKHCRPPEVVIYLPAMQAVNVTVGQHEKDVPYHELEDLEWFLQLQYGERSLRVYVNIIANRDSILIMQEIQLDVVACVTIQTVSQNLNYVFVNVLNCRSWFALLCVALAYMMVYRSISRGIDTIWPFFSLSCWFNHPRKLVCFHWICMVFLSSIYMSSISSESLFLSDFPPIPALYKKGYRFWLPQKRDILKFAGAYENRILINLFSNVMGKGNILEAENYQKRLKKIQNFLYDGNANGSIGVVHTMPLQNMSKVIEDLTTLKLFTGSNTVVRTLVTGAGQKGLVYVGTERLCKVFNVNNVKNTLTIRLWSYLSNRFSYILKSFLEVGIPTKFQKLQMDLNLDRIRKLKVTKTGVFFPPEPIKLKSAVGVSVLVLFVVGVLLVYINFIGFVPVVFKLVWNSIREVVTWTLMSLHVIKINNNSDYD